MSSENFDCFLLQQEVTYRKGACSVIFIFSDVHLLPFLEIKQNFNRLIIQLV